MSRIKVEIGFLNKQRIFEKKPSEKAIYYLYDEGDSLEVKGHRFGNFYNGFDSNIAFTNTNSEIQLVTVKGSVVEKIGIYNRVNFSENKSAIVAELPLPRDIRDADICRVVRLSMVQK